MAFAEIYLTIRPSKVDLLFPISHFLNFDEGGWSLFITRAPVILPGAFHVANSYRLTTDHHGIMGCISMVQQKDIHPIVISHDTLCDIISRVNKRVCYTESKIMKVEKVVLVFQYKWAPMGNKESSLSGLRVGYLPLLYVLNLHTTSVRLTAMMLLASVQLSQTKQGCDPQ